MSTADIVTGFDSAFRDFVSDGIPASGKHKVKKSDVRNLGATIADAIDDVATGYEVDYETRAQLYSDLDHPDDSLARVFGDSNEAYRGVYKKSGASGSGSWSRIGPLPEGDTSALEAQVNALDGDVTDLEDEVSAARGAEVSLNGRVTTIGNASSSLVDFGEELLYDEDGIVGPAKTLYVPRQIFARVAGTNVLNGNYGTASTPFPNHVACTASGSDLGTVYVDTSDTVNPLKFANSPPAMVQNKPGVVFIVAEFWRGMVKSPFPVLRLDENIKSRVQMRYPIVVLYDKVRIPSFYHYTRRDGFTQYSPTDAFYWEFDLPSSTTVETRYYFDPVAAASGGDPVKAVSSTSFPRFPRDDRFVLIGVALGRTFRTDHPNVGAVRGSIELSQFVHGNEPDRAKYALGGTLTDITNAALTALGITRGITGASAFLEGDLPEGLDAEGYFFYRLVAQANADDQFIFPRLYVYDSNGGLMTNEGSANNYTTLVMEKKLNNRAAIFFAFGRYKFPSRPARFTIGAPQTSPQNIFGGAQVYLGRNSGAYLYPHVFPETAGMDALYGPKHFSIAGRTIPFFVPSMLTAKRGDVAQPRLTIRSSASDANVPYTVSASGTIELDYDRVGSSMLFETQGGPEDAARRTRRTVANVRATGPFSGSPKVLCIGDSITNRAFTDKVRAKLIAIGLTPTMLGTIEQIGGIFGEGREAWEWQDWYHGDTQFPPVTTIGDYLALPATGTGSGTRQGHNPWVRPSTGGDPAGKVFNGHIFDFGWGRSRLSMDLPTHVAINLGTNDVNQRDPATSLAQTKKGLEILIPSIRAAGADIQIAVGMPNIPRAGFSDRKWRDEQVPAIRAIIDYVATLGDAKVDVLPYWAHMSIDTEWTETTYGTEENLTTAYVSDELHPLDPSRAYMAEQLTAWVACTL